MKRLQGMLVTWILKFTESYLFTEAEGQDKVPSEIPRQRVERSEGFLFQIKTHGHEEKILYITKRPHGQTLKMMWGKQFLPMFMWKGVLFSPLR